MGLWYLQTIAFCLHFRQGLNFLYLELELHLYKYFIVQDRLGRERGRSALKSAVCPVWKLLTLQSETTLAAIAGLTRSEVKEAVSAGSSSATLCGAHSHEDVVSPLTAVMPIGKLKGYVSCPEAEAAGKSHFP